MAKQRQCVFSEICVASVQKMAMREWNGFAHLRLSLTALAVERFRLGRGRLPERLEELLPEFVPAIPTDPFDGAPLRYRRLAKGYMIQSVGQDQKNAEELKFFGETSDLTFIVER